VPGDVVVELLDDEFLLGDDVLDQLADRNDVDQLVVASTRVTIHEAALGVVQCTVRDPQRKSVAHEADVREAMGSILGLLPA
jgi:hypothetical protein